MSFGLLDPPENFLTMKWFLICPDISPVRPVNISSQTSPFPWLVMHKTSESNILNNAQPKPEILNFTKHSKHKIHALKKHPTSISSNLQRLQRLQRSSIPSGDLGEGPQGEGVRAAQEELRPERQLRLRHHGTLDEVKTSWPVVAGNIAIDYKAAIRKITVFCFGST